MQDPCVNGKMDLLGDERRGSSTRSLSHVRTHSLNSTQSTSSLDSPARARAAVSRPRARCPRRRPCPADPPSRASSSNPSTDRPAAAAAAASSVPGFATAEAAVVRMRMRGLGAAGATPAASASRPFLCPSALHVTSKVRYSAAGQLGGVCPKDSNLKEPRKPACLWPEEHFLVAHATPPQWRRGISRL